MFGFLRRLEQWLKGAAKDALDPIGEPLHPPANLSAKRAETRFIPRKDAPEVGKEPRFLPAFLRRFTPYRVDIIGWGKASDCPEGAYIGPALLLDKSMPLEYPKHLGGLIRALDSAGISLRDLFEMLEVAVKFLPKGEPLHFILGTPMRGVRGGVQKYHLEVWEVPSTFADIFRREVSRIADLSFLKWFEKFTADIELVWCYVLEDRPEIVKLRDENTPATWFRGKTVAIWGCGALGSHIAFYLARAGVKKLVLRDSRVVTPGVLVRQAFDAEDLCENKRTSLKKALLRVRPDLEIATFGGDIVESALGSQDWRKDGDIIIDTTNSAKISLKLERLNRDVRSPRPILAGVSLSADATRAAIFLSKPDDLGALYDLSRVAKLAVCRDYSLRWVADSFWPRKNPKKLFQPVPGCSDLTYVGSSADIGALSGAMVNLLGLHLKSRGTKSGLVDFILAPHLRPGRGMSSPTPLQWLPRREFLDIRKGYQIRMAEGAWREILGWISSGRRTLGDSVETGGWLFGEIDDVLRVIWIDTASGPPPDSVHSEMEFICGVEGFLDLDGSHRKQSRGSTRYIGHWHTHPKMRETPSNRDLRGMRQIVDLDPANVRQSLLMIVGGTMEDPKTHFGLYMRNDIRGAHDGIAP